MPHNVRQRFYTVVTLCQFSPLIISNPNGKQMCLKCSCPHFETYLPWITHAVVPTDYSQFVLLSRGWPTTFLASFHMVVPTWLGIIYQKEWQCDACHRIWASVSLCVCVVLCCVVLCCVVLCCVVLRACVRACVRARARAHAVCQNSSELVFSWWLGGFVAQVCLAVSHCLTFDWVLKMDLTPASVTRKSVKTVPVVSLAARV